MCSGEFNTGLSYIALLLIRIRSDLHHFADPEPDRAKWRHGNLELEICTTVANNTKKHQNPGKYHG
jgi:hypothetical protein